MEVKRSSKSGFTLVELLAVIVILAVILAIAIPSISGVINSSTKSTFESDAKMVLNAVKYKQIENENFDYTLITVGNMQTTLGIDGSKYKQVTFELVDEELRVVLVGDKKWNGLTAYGTFKDMDVAASDEYNDGADATPPVIILIGNSTINIYKNSTYSDAGATATDNIDGDITSSINVTSNLNTSLAGSYTITYNVSDIAGNAATPVIRTINVIENLAGPSYIASKGVNGPILATGMVPINWNGTAWVDTTTEDTNWYNYDTTNKQWANARTADGSMWVWIPRYVYRISGGWHSNATGTIDVQFSKGTDDNWNNVIIGNIDTGTTSDASNNKWTNQPAFTFGATELTGFWMAKFEPTATEGVANGYTADESCPVAGDDVTTKTVKIIPNALSWRCIYEGNSYTISRKMETNATYGWGTTGSDIDTHLIKNIEWGAVAYLSKSSYGQNANEIWINNANDYTTGCAANGVNQGASTTGCLNTYDTINGVKASTTGTIYGVYDISGGAWERTSAYVDNGSGNLSYGASIISADPKYKDIYNKGAIEDQASNYALAVNKKGDALYEISSSYTGSTSWFGDYSNMAKGGEPWFMRGGHFNSGSIAGIFNFYYTNGGPYGGQRSSVSFRPVLLVGIGL